MPNFTEESLKKAIKEKDFSNLYFLFGTEKFLVKYYTEGILKGVLGEKYTSFNYQRFKADRVDIDQISDSVESLPLMSSKKFVLVEDLDIEKLGNTDQKKLYELIGDLPATCVLVISHITFEIKNNKTQKWKKFFEQIGKSGIVVELNKRTDLQLEKQLVNWAKKRNTLLSVANAKKIISYCGKELTMLRNEMEKLCAFVNYKEITETAIDAIVTRNLETTVFMLSKALNSGNYSNVYKQLDLLFYNKEEPVAILAVLSMTYIDMYRVQIAIESGVKSSELVKYFDYKGKEFRLKNAERDSKKLSTKSLRKCIEEIVKADILLKSSRIDKRVILEELVSKLMLIYKREKKC